MSRARRTRILFLLALTALVLGLTAPAGAETRSHFATWDPLTGSAGAWTTAVRLHGTGFPAASVTSDSRSGQVGVQTGATMWFGEATPPGSRYGSSRDHPYLNLRPAADNPGSPSTTTYTFEHPTPLGWAFVLGDVDADEVTVSATLADGAPAEVADLGFRSVFNLCDTTPRPGACPGPVPGDVPTWDPATATLTGNAGATDSVGAAGWFEPTAPLASLTLTFRWRSGFPIYQAWFMSRTQDVTGTVDAPPASGCDVTATHLRLTGPDGTVLDTTRPGADGSYAFRDVAATDDFSVVAVADEPCSVDSPDEVGLDLTAGDDTADFRLAAPVVEPAEVTGQVVDEEGAPVGGAEITLTDPDDGSVVAEDTTEPDGTFDLGQVEPGDYELALDPPPGFEVVGDATVDVRVRPDGTLVGDTDFVLRATGASSAPGVPTVFPAGI